MFFLHLLAFSPAFALTLCALSNSYKPSLTDTCAVGAPRASAHAARGEVEAVAVLLDNTAGGAGTVTLELLWDGGSAPVGVTASAPLLLGYVHTEKSPRYGASATGWFADALLPWPAGGAPLGPQLAAWFNFNVSATAAPGTYTGTITTGTSPAADAPLPFSLTVYSYTVPPLAASPFTTVYAFDSDILPRVYDPARVDINATRVAYLDALAGLRFPATNIYASAPLPIEEYEYLAAQGAPILILADISGLPFGEGGVAPYASRGSVRSGAAPRRAAAAACPTFSPAYVSKMVALLQPTWDALTALGLQARATVYGFDEIDSSCEPAVRQLFAAAKAAFPGVRTLSAIDWHTVPLDLPLDVWVLQYQLVNRSVTDAWVAAGHQLFVYHCIEPSGAAYLNTFNEVSLIQARLLFWYDYLLKVTGHLYYATALWLDWALVPPFYAQYTTVSGVTFQQGHAPLASRPEDTRLLTWDPANWIWAPQTTIWANGDGVFLYPGAAGADGVGRPVSTIRFEAQRDGVEDFHVMRAAAAAGGAAAVDAIVRQLVSAPTVWSQNVTLLEEGRVALLTLASGGARA